MKNKRCKNCGFILGHGGNCPKTLKCKHLFATTYSYPKHFWTMQCVKCLWLNIISDKDMKKFVNKLSKKEFKRIFI